MADIAMGTPTRRARLRLAGAIGNALEWYDFVIYGYLAPIFAQQFFPSDDRMTSLIATFGVFAAGFLMRPVGAVVVGHIGDILGRRAAVTLSVVLMAVPTTLVAILPTYESVGLLAPLLLTLCRLLQGLSVGGEYTSSTVLLIERARPGRRAFDTCWTLLGAWIGMLIGSAVAAVLSAALDESSLHDWGWRVPFLGGSVLGIVGWYLRRDMDDRPAGPELLAKQARFPLVQAIREHPRDMLSVLAMTVWAGAGYWLLLVYMTTYLVDFEKLARSLVFEINTANMVVLVLAVPPAALLSDLLGRRLVMVASAGAAFALGLPLFWLIHHPEPVVVWLGQLAFALLLAGYMGGQPAAMAELFPRHVRVSAVSVAYNIGIGIFGGLTPMLVTFLIQRTGNDFVPGYFIAAAAGLSFLGLLGMRRADRGSLG